MPTPDTISTIVSSLPDLVTRRKVAEVLGITERTVDRMCRRGELETIRVGDLVRITRASFERLLREGKLAA